MKEYEKYCPICDDYTMKRIKDKFWHYKCPKCGLRKQVLGILIVYDRALSDETIERMMKKHPLPDEAIT